MKKLILIFFLFISYTIHSQTHCYHIDCGYFPPDPEIASKIYFDTCIYFSANSDTHKKLTEFNKTSTWSWQENYKVNIFKVEDTIYLKDTLLISEGFIYRNKKNDLWTIYSQPFVPKDRSAFYAVYVGKYLYMNDVNVVSLCGLVNREDIIIDFDNSTIELKYPWETNYNKEMRTYDITTLRIMCSLDTCGSFKCQAMAYDSIKIFEVESKYLQDELNQISHYEYLLK